MRIRLAISVIVFLVFTGACPAKTSPGSQQVNAVEMMEIQVKLDGIARSKKLEIVKSKAQDDEDELVYLNGAPAHLRLCFDPEKYTGDKVFYQPYLEVFPLKPYGAIFKDARKVEFDKHIQTLKSIIAKKNRNAKEIPVLPPSEAAQLFVDKLTFLNFKQGTGVSYLVAYGQDDIVTNENLGYGFQGFTSDGKYYLSFYSPVTLSSLSNDKPFKAAVEQIKRTAPEKFSPPLGTINKLLSSISLVVKK